MPLAVYLALETDPAAAVVLSLLLLAVSALVLAALRGGHVSARERAEISALLDEERLRD